MTTDKLLTTNEVKDILRMQNIRSVHKLIHAGELNYIRANEKKFLVPTSSVNEYIARHMIKRKDSPEKTEG